MLLALAALMAGCALSGPGASIPTRAFASNRATNFAYQISPDGKKLAWLAVQGTALALHVKELDSARLMSGIL